jgi:Uma2 family endonuclease
MSTRTTYPIAAFPPHLEFSGPSAVVPSLEELDQLTDIPDRRVVFRDVDWSFYEQLVDSIPERCHIHVDYDGKDLEIVRRGPLHQHFKGLLRQIVGVTAEELFVPYESAGSTTWKRRDILRGLEADESFYFLPEKMAADAAALQRHSDDIADYPNPDLAIEVDISPPQVDRAGIYAALRVAEVWRFDGHDLVIERLTAEGTYVAAEASGFVPVRAEDAQRWLVREDSRDHSAWTRRLRAEIRSRKTS